MPGLIRIQTVCKRYQQATPVGKMTAINRTIITISVTLSAAVIKKLFTTKNATKRVYACISQDYVLTRAASIILP